MCRCNTSLEIPCYKITYASAAGLLVFFFPLVSSTQVSLLKNELRQKLTTVNFLRCFLCNLQLDCLVVCFRKSCLTVCCYEGGR